MATATATRQISRPCQNDCGEERARAKQLLEMELDFIDNKEFKKASVAKAILERGEGLPSSDSEEPAGQTHANDLPAHLARLCATSLLTAEEERLMFRRMNFLKYRATRLRCRIDLDEPDAEQIDELENLIHEAQRVRDHIVQANMRLVISIVKKYVSPTFSFDELLSDGIEVLINAVEKFDYERGFRFSTYAYRSIARNAFRKVNDRKREFGRYAAVAEESLEGSLEDGGTASMSERTWERLRSLLGRFLRNLDDRERMIVRARYALGNNRKIQTFQSIADKLGVSKERVRQLEQRAVGKLQKMADEQAGEAAE